MARSLPSHFSIAQMHAECQRTYSLQPNHIIDADKHTLVVGQNEVCQHARRRRGHFCRGYCPRLCTVRLCLSLCRVYVYSANKVARPRYIQFACMHTSPLLHVLCCVCVLEHMCISVFVCACVCVNPKRETMPVTVESLAFFVCMMSVCAHSYTTAMEGYTHTHTHTNTHTHTHTHTHTQHATHNTHKRTLTHPHTHTHIHTFTHTHTHVSTSDEGLYTSEYVPQITLLYVLLFVRALWPRARLPFVTFLVTNYIMSS